MSMRNALFITICTLLLGGCGKGPGIGTEMECFISGPDTFTFAAAGVSSIESYSLFVTYDRESDGATVPYSSYEFTVRSTVDAFLPCVGDNCVPGVATRTLESKASGDGVALFDAIVSAAEVSNRPVDIFLFGNTKPAGCSLPINITIAAP